MCGASAYPRAIDFARFRATTDEAGALLLADISHISGWVAECALESCGIVVNKNLVPDDRRGPRTTSGLRFGATTLALRGMGEAEMERCTGLVDRCLRAVQPLGDRACTPNQGVCDAIRAGVGRVQPARAPG